MTPKEGDLVLEIQRRKTLEQQLSRALASLVTLAELRQWPSDAELKQARSLLRGNQ